MKKNYNKTILEIKYEIKLTENFKGVLLVPKISEFYYLKIYKEELNSEFRVGLDLDPVNPNWKNTDNAYAIIIPNDTGFHIQKSGNYKLQPYSKSHGRDGRTWETKYLYFNINKATGKNVTLSKPQSTYYAGIGGAFGLVNGITTDKGSDGSEWLGWKTDSLEITIDLNKTDTISKISLHYLAQEASGMYEPLYSGISISNDGNNFNQVTGDTKIAYSRNDGLYMILPEQKQITRYIKISLKPQKNKWLLLDEVVVE